MLLPFFFFSLNFLLISFLLLDDVVNRSLSVKSFKNRSQSGYIMIFDFGLQSSVVASEVEGGVALEPEEDAAEDGAGSTEKSLRPHQSFRSNRTAHSLFLFVFLFVLFFYTDLRTNCLLAAICTSKTGGGLQSGLRPLYFSHTHTHSQKELFFYIGLTGSGPSLTCCPFILIVYFCRRRRGCRKT